MTKNPFQSKTFIFNLLYVILAIAALFGWLDFQPGSNVKELAALIVGAINLYLRYNTHGPINFSVWRK